MPEDSLMDRVLGPSPPPFALLYRPGTGPGDLVEALVGRITLALSPTGVPLPGPGPADGETAARYDALVLVRSPRGAEDGPGGRPAGPAPLVLTVTERADVPLREVVTRILAARFPDPGLDVFRRLLEGGRDAYWTCLVHTGARTLVGAAAAPHLTLRAGTAVLTAGGGTYHAPAGGPGLAGVVGLLTDRADENRARLSLDTALAAMTRICAGEVRVRGPWLRETAAGVRTEYAVQARCDRDPRHVLYETRPASDLVALLGRDRHGAAVLDSAVLDIATPESATPDTTVRTRAALPGAGAAPRTSRAGGLGTHARVRALLEARNDTLAHFWFGRRKDVPARGLAGRRTLVVDAGDGFLPMLVHQLAALGLDPRVRRPDEPFPVDDGELVVLGAGPHDPRLTRRPEIARLRETAGRLLAGRRPFLALCLAHQVTCGLLGLGRVRRIAPREGVQRTIDLFGSREPVGLYDTFTVHGDTDRVTVDGLDSPVETSRDPLTGEVYALRGKFFASLQFRPESVLTQHGERILGALIRHALAGAASRPS
ncbi:aminodeoxychorismate/anthranilate synthase component II [Streptomyces leeuwenhoekii]|uniref:Anthranilate synthase, phenazine specific n=1 Tax=Streptomyces leeuwenhoekii TaxID=1437453 RepID=A0A0F7W365_STRLW|nr:aminodeoxychorismate/anthranilate synthase component II [Streptomyces leeuwenhoekii]CQR65198.1 Anthranilate synthase, phenazine specific [Streptomyces leeuwenhoekii]